MFGLLVSHVRDVYFLMITLALGMVLWGLSYRWIPVTGGDNGISGIPRLEAHAGLPFGGPVAFYYVTLLVFVVCGALMALLVRSPFGFTLRGIRENEGADEEPGLQHLAALLSELRRLRRVCQRGRRDVGVLQRLRQPDVSGSDRLVRAVPDGDARRSRRRWSARCSAPAPSCC